MKCLFKALILLAVFSTANVAYADKVSMCQVAEEASQGKKIDYAYNDIDVAVVCDDDIQIKNVAKSDQVAFSTSFAKGLLKFFGHNGEFKFHGFSFSQVYDDSFLPIFLLMGICFAVYHSVWKGVAVARLDDKSVAIVDLVTYAALFLISILAIWLHHWIRAPQAIVGTAYVNGLSNTSLFYMAQSADGDRGTYDEAEAYEVVSMMDKNSQNLLRNAFVEQTSKYMCLQVKVTELARSDYLSFKNTSSTLGEILNNFENNVRYDFKIEKEHDVAQKYIGNWYTDFPDYNEDKYCSQSLGFEIGNDSFPSNFDNFDKDAVAKIILIKAMADGSKFMYKDRTKQQLSKYENEAFAAIRGDGLKTILRRTDDLVNTAESAVIQGLKEVEQILINEKVDPSLFGYYQNGYVNIFSAAAKGIQNDSAVMNEKMTYARKHALYAKTWNCSNNFDNHINTRYQIKQLNKWGAGANFADASDDVGKVDWSCTVAKNGVAVFAGTDDKAKIAEFSDRALAIAAAFAMFDSRIGEGVRRGNKNFNPKVDVLANEILAIASKGKAGFGFASIPYRKISTMKAKAFTSINNAYGVSIVANNGWIDETMLFGSEKDKKDLANSPYYKNVIANAKVMRLEALIDDTKGSAGISYDVAGIKENAGGIMEMAKAFLENSFDYNENLKENLGLDRNLSYEAGYNQCKMSPAICQNRYSGTLTDIVVGGGQDIFSASFKFYMLLEVLEAAKMVGDIGSLADMGFSSNNAASGAILKFLSLFGKTTAIVITLLHALLVGFKPLVLFAMVIGFVAGWIIPMLEAIMSLLQSLNYVIGYWIASFVFLYRVTKGLQSGKVAYLLEAFLAYFTVWLVSLFSTMGMVIVQWATKSMTVGHELSGLLGITSDVFLVGNLAGTIAIHAVSLYFMYHIYQVPTKAGQIAESITKQKMHLTDVHTQNGRLESFATGAATKMAAVSPVNSAKQAAAEKVAKGNHERKADFENSRRAGEETKKNPPPKSTEGI